MLTRADLRNRAPAFTCAPALPAPRIVPRDGYSLRAAVLRGMSLLACALILAHYV